MKFAYADPPYFGHGKRLYGKHHPNAADFDQIDFHKQLIAQLILEYPDGWALSCNPSDLPWVLPLVPDGSRVCSWVKTFHQIRPNVNIQYSWEPVILQEGRIIRGRKPMVRDHMACQIAMKKGLTGSKPDKFCDWILDLLGFDPLTDTVDDLFPGTGGMAQAVMRRNLVAEVNS